MHPSLNTRDTFLSNLTSNIGTARWDELFVKLFDLCRSQAQLPAGYPRAPSPAQGRGTAMKSQCNCLESGSRCSFPGDQRFSQSCRDPHNQILSQLSCAGCKLLIPEDGVVRVSVASKLQIIYVNFSLQVAASMGRDMPLFPTSTLLLLILHCLSLFYFITWDLEAIKPVCSFL